MKKATWHRPGALGDILATMNLVKNFKEKNKECALSYKCHPDLSPIVKDIIFEMGFIKILDSTFTDFDGVQFNLIGYPIPPKGNHPHEPMKKHLIEYFAEELQVQPDFDSFVLPKPAPLIKGDYITVHVKAGWSPYKNWEVENWNNLAWQLGRQGIAVVQVGGPGDTRLRNAKHFIRPLDMGAYDPNKQFMASLNCIANAKVHMGIDSWTSHICNVKWSGEKRTPAVIIWGSSQFTATGYPTSTTSTYISKGKEVCSLWPCFKEDPKISSTPLSICENPPNQTYENPQHMCMTSVTVKEVFDKVMELWERKS